MERGTSKIEKSINDIEEFIDSCKPQPFSSTKIIVDKEVLDELLADLRQQVPGEIRKYQRLLSNKDEILADAKSQADAMIADATAQTQELLDEHEIMQRATKKANEMLDRAQRQAQSIVDQAAADATEIRESGMDYVENMLKNMDSLIMHTIEDSNVKYNNLLTSLTQMSDIIHANLAEMNPADSSPEEEGSGTAESEEENGEEEYED